MATAEEPLPSDLESLTSEYVDIWNDESREFAFACDASGRITSVDDRCMRNIWRMGNKVGVTAAKES